MTPFRQYDPSTYLPASTFLHRKTGKLALKKLYQCDVTQNSFATARKRDENNDFSRTRYTSHDVLRRGRNPRVLQQASVSASVLHSNIRRVIVIVRSKVLFLLHTRH